MDLTHKALRSGASPFTAKLLAIRTCLYVAGPWNEGRSFLYDLENAQVREPMRSQSLPWCLRHRRGNCVSMPALFMAMCEHLGLDAAFSCAPFHFFVKVRDASGYWHNIECTDKGGIKSDASYIRELEITPEALANGLYLRPLTRTQALLALMESVSFDDWKRGSVTGLHSLADLFDEFEPRGLNAVLMRKRAFELQLNREYIDVYPRWNDVPPAMVDGARRIMAAIHDLERQAQAKGWRQATAAMEAAYLRSIARAMQSAAQ